MWQKGDEVLARREGLNGWLRGAVRVVKGDNVYVEFEDGVFELATELRKPEATPRPDPEPETTEYALGDRVLGRWLDLWWYPGTILSHDQGRHQVQFDDNDRGALLPNQLMPLRLEVGDAVQCRPKGEVHLSYRPASVTRVAGEVIDVEFDDGDKETNTHVSRIRLWRCPARPADFSFNEGDRILAIGPEGYCYPADIISIDGDRILLHYLLGGDGLVTPELIKPLEVTTGLRVEGRWRGGNAFFPGSVDEVRGEKLHIKYDDGDEEWTTIRLVRIGEAIPPPTGLEPASAPVRSTKEWKVGDRVLARWGGNGLWYAGTIQSVEGEGYQVAFDDGDQGHVAANGLTPLLLPVGSQILAPRPGMPSYVRAEVRRFDGERLLLRYDDGTEATIELRHVCVPLA